MASGIVFLYVLAFILMICIAIAPLYIWKWTKRSALSLEHIEKLLHHSLIVTGQLDATPKEIESVVPRRTAPERTTQPTAPAAPAVEVTCPGCQRKMSSAWGVCPKCHTALPTV